MKKKTINIICLFFIFSSYKLFAIPEISLNVYWAGFSYGLARPKFSELTTDADENSIKGDIGSEIAVLIQPGYSFDYKGDSVFKGVSVLLDIGYYRHSITTKYDYKPILSDKGTYANTENIIFDSINIGIIPKINFSGCSIGIGAGIKMPFKAEIKNSIWNVPEGSLALRYRGSDDLTYRDFKDMFEYPFTPYIKMSADIFMYITKKFAILITPYISYDFGMKYDKNKLRLNWAPDGTIMPTPGRNGTAVYKQYSVANFSFGLSTGFYFGRNNSRDYKPLIFPKPVLPDINTY